MHVSLLLYRKYVNKTSFYSNFKLFNDPLFATKIINLSSLCTLIYNISLENIVVLREKGEKKKRKNKTIIKVIMSGWNDFINHN